MPAEHIVVDGSNIATEGRSAPSLAQLEDAVKELRREFPEAEVTVIVDATFAHRIDPSELERFEQAALAGEYAHPPAGAIGRGDAFLLRIAEKVDAIVLSNDSFQEFHGEHPWLFERGRLIGATPVPGIGWIFMPRTPVRGPRSRKAVKDIDKERRKVSKAIEAATKEAVSPRQGGHARDGSRRAAKRGGEATGDGAARSVPAAKTRTHTGPMPSAVNDPLTFISFIAEHPLGSEVAGRVESYTSHGAVVFVGGVQCYVPLTNMADPPPRSARSVLKRDEERTFVVTALDPLRRGVELALPGTAEVSGRPSEETIAAEMRLAKKKTGSAKKAAAPTKKAAGSAKKAVGPAKKAAAPATEAGTAKKARASKPPEAATSAEKLAPPAKQAAKAPARKDSPAPSGKAKAPTGKATPGVQSGGAADVTGQAAGQKVAGPRKKAVAAPERSATNRAARVRRASTVKKQMPTGEGTESKKAPSRGV